MGLLDQILGGLAGNVQGGSPMGSPAAGGGGGGMSNVLVAMLPVVLGMLANRQQAGGSAAFPGLGGAAAPGGMGGLGGLGAGMGGLGGLLEQLTRSGYGQQANSWVGTGANEAIPAHAWSDVFGADGVASIAAQAGVSEDEARAGLSELVPNVVDHLTPQGQMPEQDQLFASLSEFTRRLGG